MQTLQFMAQRFSEKTMDRINHYDWLDANLDTLFANLGKPIDYVSGLISAHGDKCYGYKMM